MGTFRPTFQQQGPDSNCVISGHYLGWESCTAYAMAMTISRAKLLGTAASGCQVRRYTGDTSGGLTLPQVAAVARDKFGVSIETHVGSNVCTPQYAARQVRAGHPMVLQGNAQAMLGTSRQSTAGAVNHAVMVNEVRGGTLDVPAEALVYDPAADGRNRVYHVDQGPSWWPWSLVLKFAQLLRPWGDSDPRMLGTGKFYAAFGPDTEPHVILHSGAKRSTPFPDRARAKADGTVIHSRPGTSGYRIGTLDEGDLFVAFQYWVSPTNGNRWLGDQDNRQWVLASRMSHVGGVT